ncbi:hypothetical protein VTI74DRAFT_11156 [Chaetomium olivicolor]
MAILPPPPPPPPPPPKSIFPPASPPSQLSSLKPIPEPDIPATGPPGFVEISLLVYNGYPFANHWEYFVASPHDRDAGVVVQAAGDVRAGFWLEVKRGVNLRLAENRVEERVRLGWVAADLFAGGSSEDGEDNLGMEVVFGLGKDGMVTKGEVVVERTPRCEFEKMLFKVPAPEKTLRAVGDGGGQVERRTRIMQRNCQTWVIESAEFLVREGLFEQGAVDYLRARTQC